MPIQKDPEGIEILNLKKVADFTDRQVLEIGCGDGRLTFKYAPFAGHVTAIDPDVTALLAATTATPVNLKQVPSFIGANAIDLPFPTHRFDLALLSWSL
jgi:ubiquinone/menaquinone biosynthesis C-methylase UbiE